MKIEHAKFANASEEVDISRNFTQVSSATEKKVLYHSPIILSSRRNDGQLKVDGDS